MPQIFRKTKGNLLLIFSGLFILLIALMVLLPSFSKNQLMLKDWILMFIFLPMGLFFIGFGIYNYFIKFIVDSQSLIYKSLLKTIEIPRFQIEEFLIINIEMGNNKTANKYLLLKSSLQLPYHKYSKYIDINLKILNMMKNLGVQDSLELKQLIEKLSFQKQNYADCYVLLQLSGETKINNRTSKIISGFDDGALIAAIKQYAGSKFKEL